MNPVEIFSMRAFPGAEWEKNLHGICLLYCINVRHLGPGEERAADVRERQRWRLVGIVYIYMYCKESFRLWFGGDETGERTRLVRED